MEIDKSHILINHYQTGFESKVSKDLVVTVNLKAFGIENAVKLKTLSTEKILAYVKKLIPVQKLKEIFRLKNEYDALYDVNLYDLITNNTITVLLIKKAK